MREVHFESTAYGDVLVDENGDLLNIIFEGGGGSTPSLVPWKESVETVGDLPPADNVSGDARLVRSEKRIYMWDSVDGWQVLADSVGGAFVLSVNGDSPVDKLDIKGPNVKKVYTAATDLMTITVSNPTSAELGLQRSFIPLDTNEAGGITQPVLETNPAIAGARYLCGYMHDASGFVIFRGFFVAAANGSSLIGIVEEDHRPPHTVRMAGVCENGALFAVRIEPNGEVYSYGHQLGANHLDGCSFYEGEGPLVVIGTFIPDPNNPYRIQSGAPMGGARSFKVVGSGIFQYPRNTNIGRMTFDIPNPPEGVQGYNTGTPSQVTYEVINGLDVGQTGVAEYTWSGGFGDDFIEIIIPSGLRGEVRITFVNFTLVPVTWV